VNDRDWVALLVQHTLQPGQAVLDIGANAGLFTEPMADAVGAEGQIWAIEPDLVSVQYLLARVPGVMVINVALGDQDGKVDFWIRPTDSRHHSLYRDAVPFPDQAKALKVRVATLDALYRAPTVPVFDFIKIDAQGAEGAILSQAKTALASDAAWLIEFWPHGLACAGWTVDRLIHQVQAFTPYTIDQRRQLQQRTWGEILVECCELPPQAGLNVGLAKPGSPIAERWQACLQERAA